MDKEFLKKAITEQLNAINEQYEIIRGYDKKIPQIELDIILSNMREMYQYLYALDKQNQAAISEVKASVPKPEAPEKIKEKVAEEDALSLTKRKPQEPEEKKPEVEKLAGKKPVPPPAVKHETKPEPSPEIKPQKQEVPPPQPAPEKAPVPAIKANGSPRITQSDLAEGSSKTIADKLTKEDEVRIADKVGQKVESLKRAIGINEKFLFINEMFNGKLTEYNNAIKQLDEMPDADSCMNEFNRYAADYNWEKDSPTYHRLKEFIQKKHDAQE